MRSMKKTLAAMLLSAGLIVAWVPGAPAQAAGKTTAAASAVAWLKSMSGSASLTATSATSWSNLGEVVAGMGWAGANSSDLSTLLTRYRNQTAGFVGSGSATNGVRAAKALYVSELTNSTSTSFGGVNLVSAVTGRLNAGWLRDGTGKANVFAHSIAVFSLAKASALPQAPVTALVGQQCTDGSFPINPTAPCSSSSEVDATAMALLALREAKAAGATVNDTVITRAATALGNRQTSGGGFPASPMVPTVNSNSTGLAAAALNGINNAKTAQAVSWLNARQILSGANKGAIAYSATGTDPELRLLRSTAQGVYGLAIPFDVYSTPGTHSFNGRLWQTSCEKYSSTVSRCRTNIQATVIKQRPNGAFYSETGWAFNNLTYQPSPRRNWEGNPLATPGIHVVDGRSWRTHCDDDLSGRNGCRSYLYASYIENTARAGQPPQYKWVKGYIFNNIVKFS